MTPALQVSNAMPRPPLSSPALEFSRSTRGKATHVSLHAALRRTLAFDGPLPGATLVHVDDSGDDAWIAACEDDVRTILGHLLRHAIRQCPTGHCVDIAVQPDHPGATVVVRDVKPGLTPVAMPGIVDIDTVAARDDARFVTPDLALLQKAVRALGARVLVGERGQNGPSGRCGHRVFVSVQFPPPFNVVAGSL